MADILKGIILTILTEKCYTEYFVKYNFLDVPCFKASLSKGLGIGIIAGSVLVKVPQILKILKSKSAEGINIYGVYLELFAITANFAYSYVMNFPFSAWGEGTFLAIQTAVIAALVLYYGGSSGKAISFISMYIALVSAVVSGFAPKDLLWTLQAVNVPIIVAAKSIQVITNYRNGSTGQLSAVTCFLLFGGSIARIFTSIQETGDFIIILNYCVSTLTNGIIVLQLFWYWNVDKTSKNKNKKKK
ncbi:mannose-P-dolichol utilization defect 1 protein homolog [Danaus plexippus]|uniref:Mannose-P-dolichol utilization defect 1 protein homolog n=1 Tax=Danaus plexippus plexippus TaxID=278856 RepID=A0A212F7E3_DANPL|nr:mannose-P-dolichol utilization defect 1 protein homolog [Danaus plexippus]XP_032510596.1 mannose-P-dolichol utilization defect 1 protein homolog [Danaus plexippus]OWR49652.1 mannose-P-dolichol utilization defect 1 protein [Danaus plexippus plexippus]